MRIFLFLIAYLIHEINCTINDNIVKYLDNQAIVVSEKLIRYTRQEENFYNVKFNHIHNMKLIGNYSAGEIFTIFNNSYALMDQDLYKISQNNYSVLNNFLPKEEITLLKATEFGNMGFLLLVTKVGTLHIFGFNNQTQKFFKIQNIIHNNISDATFFKNENNLYLVISNFESKYPTFTIIYKFVNSHFDELKQITTKAAVKVFTFPSNGSEIIVILQDFEWTTIVYKFKNGNIFKIQQIDTINPKQVLSYFYDQKRYLLIFDKDIKLFLWTGSELLLLEELKMDISSEKKGIIYADNNPYLITFKNDTFMVYTLINNLFKLVYNSEIGENISQILNYEIWSQSNKTNNLIILSFNPNNSIEIILASVAIKEDLLTHEITEEEEEKLSNCFLNLERTVYTLRNKLNIATNQSDYLLREADNFEDQSPEEKLEELQIKYSSVKSTVEDYLSNEDILVINETTILKNPVEAKNITVKDLHFENLNNKKWEPEQWLSYTKPQKVSSLVKAQFVHVKNLETNDPFFDELLLGNGNQLISGSVVIQNLDSSQIETDSINDIPMENLFYKNKPVVIQGQKRFSKLEIENLEIGSINEVEGRQMGKFLTNPKLSKYVFDSNLKIDNLWVKNINEIDFDQFKNSVFRLGLTDTIEGNLTFLNLEAKNMSFSSLAHRTDFLTTSTNQTINSSITFSKIFTKNVNANTINGIDFTNSVATFDGSVINGPVTVKDVKIKNNLEMRGKIDKLFLTMLNKTHIIGTSESDLLQRYNKKVTIKGNLILKNLDLGTSARMIVNKTEIDPKLDQFWTKTTHQIIDIHFEAKNGISTPHLFATLINGHDFDNYMLNSTEAKTPTKFYFEDVTVRGNVTLDPNEQHTPDLQKIQKESVKVNGTFTIRGRKRYVNILKIDKLQVEKLNNAVVTVADMVNEVEISVPKRIQNLIIQGNLHCQNLSTDTVNNIDLLKLLEDSLYIDQPEDLQELNFEKLSAKNLYVITNLNDHHIDELVLKVENVKSLDNINDLYLDGNVTIVDVHNLATINNIDLDTLLRDGMSKVEDDTIYGNVKFMGNVKIEDLYVTIVNDVDLPKLTKRNLYKFWNQTITKPFKFTTLKTTNLITDNINEIYLGNLIDVTSTEPQTLFVSNGLRLTEPTSMPNLVSDGLECNLEDGLQNLRSPLPQFWDTVTIKGNTTILDKESIISQIFDKVVINDSRHVITGHVIFINHICANNITTLGRVNSIDILEILQDAVLNDQKIEQIITGRKTFIDLMAKDVKILQNVDVSKINDYEIIGISKNIVDKHFNKPITGKKVLFGGLQTKKIETEMIVGIKSEDLVSFSNPKKVTSAIFDSVNVQNNFNVQFINNMEFDNFLNDRLLKVSNTQTVIGRVFFKNININENISTPHINDIKTENVVFDYGIQTIESGKKFLEDLNIIGNISSDFINGFKLSEAYEKAIIKNEDANFNGTVRIFGPTLINGNISTNYINNFPMSHITETSAKHSLQSEANQIHKITQKISDFVAKYLNTTIRMPTEYLYIEKSADLQISIPNTINAQIVETRDDILIHLESEESGNFCGLPKTCKCPFQQTMQISSEHSIGSFINKGSQRIYSYSDDNIIIHLVSNSISTNNFCRTNKTKVMNEVSSLSWNTIPRENITGGFFMHQTFFSGYISGVKFFTSYGKTYVVIGFYYDSVVDTHAMNCLVLRFNEDKTAVDEIQKIPTEGVKTVSLFPTAQGVILIIGNEKGMDVGNVTTQIFRFDRYREQFELLREVPTFGSLFAVGVVLEIDSLIILANRHSILHILKYQEKFDNYYFYQSFQLDYPVSSMSVFYGEGFGISDAYLSVVATNNKYFIYSFQFVEGWKLESVGELEGIKSLIPFRLNHKSYLFAPSSKISSLLTLVEHDSD